MKKHPLFKENVDDAVWLENTPFRRAFFLGGHGCVANNVVSDPTPPPPRGGGGEWERRSLKYWNDHVRSCTFLIKNSEKDFERAPLDVNVPQPFQPHLHFIFCSLHKWVLEARKHRNITRSGIRKKTTIQIK